MTGDVKVDIPAPLREIIDGSLPADDRIDDYRRVLAALPDGVVVVDGRGTVVLANRLAEETLGVEGTRLLGHQFGLPLADHRAEAEIEVPSIDGSYRVVRLRMVPIRWGHENATLLLTEDVTTPAAEFHEMETTRVRYELAVRGSNDGLWDWDLVDGTMHVSARWRELLGLFHYPDDDHDPSIWLDRTMDEDKTALLDALDTHLSGRSDLFEVEHRLRHRDGTYRWMLARGRAVFDAEGEPTRLAGSITDISARKRLEAQLRHEARHDPLTGLANRRLFIERSETVLARAERTRSTFAIGLLDLDGFKQINDVHGHERGDDILVEVARRITELIRPTDLAARLGGDEFALVLEDIGSRDAVGAVVERLQTRLAEPHSEDGLIAQASIGVCVAEGGGHDVGALLRAADKGMYEAKSSGTSTITFA